MSKEQQEVVTEETQGATEAQVEETSVDAAEAADSGEVDLAQLAAEVKAQRGEETPAEEAKVAEEPKAQLEPAAETEAAEQLPPDKLALLAKAQKRIRKEAEAERAKLEAEKAAIAADKKDLEEWKSLRGRLMDDLPGVAKALGLSHPEDITQFATALYWSVHPEHAPADFKTRSLVQQRTMTAEQKLAEMQRRIDDMERQAQERIQATQEQAQVAAYQTTLKSFVVAAPETLPYLKAAVEAHGADAVADEMLDLARAHIAHLSETDPEALEDYEAPTADKLAAALEQTYKKRFEPFAKLHSKPSTPIAAETKPATRTLSNKAASATTTRPAPQSEEDLIRELENDLRAGRIGAP